MANLGRLCGNSKGQSVKERQNQDKVKQKGHERRQQAGNRGEGGEIKERNTDTGEMISTEGREGRTETCQ